MTTNQTIDGVPRGLLERLLAVSGTVDHARALSELRALLGAPIPFPGCPPVPEDRKLPAVQYREVDGEHCQNPECCAWIDPNSECTQCKPADQSQGDTPDDDKSHPRFIAGYTAGLHDHNLGQHQGEPAAYRYMDCNTGTCGPTKCGGIYYAEIPEYGRSWEVTTKSHGSVLIERKQHAIANGFVDSHPSLTVIIEPLYAERPAPVAVVLPERLTTAELEELEVIEAFIHGQGLSNLAGSMAAARQFIDEVTRLNTK